MTRYAEKPYVKNVDMIRYRW